MTEYHPEMNAFCDFHIHVGYSHGRPVKMAASKHLTVPNILEYSLEVKGLQVITLIDGVCPPVQDDLVQLLSAGDLMAVPGGGYLYRDELLVLPGGEIEVSGPNGGASHFGSWFGSLEAAIDFTGWLRTVQKNVSLSSQKVAATARELQHQVKDRGGIFIVHHAFTPHKGAYGNCVVHLSEMLDMKLVDAVELGLSADTNMGDCLTELRDVTFLTNSDAHSLEKIAREYNELQVEKLNFHEIRLALRRLDGRRISRNFGMEPRLGKYHYATCRKCGQRWDWSRQNCICGSKQFTNGVYDRWKEIRDVKCPKHPLHRPPYVAQVPLEFIPGLGPGTRTKLFQKFGSEMNVLHQASKQALAEICGEKLANYIDLARTGQLAIIPGGGGVYGRLESPERPEPPS